MPRRRIEITPAKYLLNIYRFGTSLRWLVVQASNMFYMCNLFVHSMLLSFVGRPWLGRVYLFCWHSLSGMLLNDRQLSHQICVLVSGHVSALFRLDSFNVLMRCESLPGTFVCKDLKSPQRTISSKIKPGAN